MNQNQIGSFKNYLYLIFLSFLFLTGCAKNTTLETSMEECNSSVETIQSYGDTIRLKYNIENESVANRIAGEWCTSRKKFVEKNTTNCDGCCLSTYICKSQ